MVEAVRRTRAGGLEVVMARRAAAERSAKDVSCAVVAPSRARARGRARGGCHKGWQVGSFLQRAAGFLRSQGFLAALAHCFRLSDPIPACFAKSHAPEKV